MDFLNLLPKKTADYIQNNYTITEVITINSTYGVYKNRDFIENVLIKNIIDNDIHIYYTVQTIGRDYMKNEIVPRHQTLFLSKIQAPVTKKIEDKSKQRLKHFFRQNYLKK
jgi:hypothetical protein